MYLTEKNNRREFNPALALHSMGILVALLIALSANFSYAQTAPTVTTSFIRDFARISFEWPNEVRIKSSTRGNRLTIEFAKAAKINPVPILKNLSPYITRVQQSGDNKTLFLDMNRPYSVRSFVSSNISGVDILRLSDESQQVTTPAPAPKASTPSKPAKPKQATKQSSKKFAKPPAPQQKPSPPKTVEAAKKKVEKPTPPAKPEKVVSKEKSPPIVEEEKSAQPPVAALTQASPKTEPSAPSPSEEKEAPAASKHDAAIIERSEKEIAREIAQEAGHSKQQKDEPVIAPPTADKVNLVKSDRAEQVILSFPWEARTAAAAFRRGDRVLVAFNRAQPMSLKVLEDHPDIQQPKWLKAPAKDTSLLSFITNKSGLRLKKEEGNYHWQLILNDAPQLPKTIIPTQPKVEPPLRPHLFMPVLQSSEPLVMTDEVVGDQLTIIPLYAEDEGVFPRRQFVEFEILPTAQGIAIKEYSEGLRIARLRNGLKITRPKTGIMLSEDLPRINLPEIRASIPSYGDIFYPYEEWIAPAETAPLDFEHQLLARTSETEGDKSAAARTRLAQFYLAYDRPHEALSLLNLVRRYSPDYYDKNKLSALRGAANFMAYRFNDADQDFKDPALDKETEIALWRDSLDLLFTQDGKADFMDYEENFISHYPPTFQKRLALIAADHWVRRGRFNRALKIFNQLHKQDQSLTASIRPHINLVVAKISAESKKTEEAEHIWNDLAENAPDKFVQVRAKFDHTRYLLAEGMIDLQEAIDRLDPLRIQWRGDQFELNLLTLLGRLYEATTQYREALRVWRDIINAFPDNPDNIALRAKMGEMFVQLFNEGAADKLEPLNALALYYEFRDLTPVGKDGDIMIRNLVDRLVSVDLLDRAAALLEHQVRFRTSGEERSRIGAQLALLKLLNRKAEEALQTLEVTGYGQNPEELRETRALLTARALAELGEAERALALLAEQESEPAQLLKLEIHWDEKNWPAVTVQAEEILSAREDPTQPITKMESDVLLKLALSYVFQGEPEQVQYLRDYFLPLMKGNENEELFRFITRDAPVDPQNLSQLTSHITALEGFLDSYRSRIAHNGLSGAIN